MSVKQARQHCIAVGKLNVVHAEGKEPHLVLDSTVCGVNPKCNIPERVSLPMASDVRLAFMPGDTRASFIGASFDFKAARKQIQVHPSERLVTLPFCRHSVPLPSVPFRSPLLRTLVATHSSSGCYTGCYQHWLFVDDLLAALRRPDARQQLALIVIFFAAISAPADLVETIELTPLKTLKLKEQLHALLRSKRVKRELLEQVLGLLIWATSLSSWLAPLYADLHSLPGCMISVNARLWPAFLSALNAKAILASPVHGVFMPLGSRVLKPPSDLPSVVPCFETLAQLALMRVAWATEGQAVHGLCMPSGTDNTASEAGVNKLFTTAWPLQIFVQLVAAWAYKRKWSVLASRIPGERNVWADQLSRGNTSAFDSKPHARFRFRPHDFWPHKSALSLHPPDAPWRPEHRSASQTL